MATIKALTPSAKDLSPSPPRISGSPSGARLPPSGNLVLRSSSCVLPNDKVWKDSLQRENDFSEEDIDIEGFTSDEEEPLDVIFEIQDGVPALGHIPSGCTGGDVPSAAADVSTVGRFPQARPVNPAGCTAGTTPGDGITAPPNSPISPASADAVADASLAGVDCAPAVQNAAPASVVRALPVRLFPKNKQSL